MYQAPVPIEVEFFAKPIVAAIAGAPTLVPPMTPQLALRVANIDAAEARAPGRISAAGTAHHGKPRPPHDAMTARKP